MDIKIFDLPSNEEAAIEFFRDVDILHRKRVCKNGHEMKFYNSNFSWRCNTKDCNQRFGVRTGTWFENSRIDLLQALRFIYFWSYEQSSIKWCQHQLELSDKTVIDWNSYLREVCIKNLEEDSDAKIGGPGMTVEIDESLFTQRQSHNGHVLPQKWIFGGMCRETKDTFLVQVPNRTAATLMHEIGLHIANGSTIMTDLWSSYQTDELVAVDFDNFKVDHDFNFIDSTKHAGVQKLFGSAKGRNKRQRGTSRHHLDSYLAESMWRRKQDMPFDAILRAISRLFPHD